MLRNFVGDLKLFSTEICSFFLLSCLRGFFFFGSVLFFPFSPFCEAQNARNLQSSRTTRPQFDRIKKSIMARRAFFFLFFRPFFLLLLLLPLGGRACARSALSFREIFFVFLPLAMGSRSRAPVLWDRATRMTLRETNGCIRSLSGCERFFSRSNVTQNFFSGGVF